MTLLDQIYGCCVKIIKSTGFVCYWAYGKEAGENHEVIYIFLNKLANKVTSSTALIIFIILLLSKCHGKQASLKKTYTFICIFCTVCCFNKQHVHIINICSHTNFTVGILYML